MIGAVIVGTIGPIIVTELKKKVFKAGIKVSKPCAEHTCIKGLEYLHKVANEQLPKLIRTLKKDHNFNESCPACNTNANRSFEFC